MGRVLVSIRIEVDQDVNETISKITRAEERTSKREQVTAIVNRVAREWLKNPAALRQLGIVRD